jgi:hypothetical protein
MEEVLGTMVTYNGSLYTGDMEYVPERQGFNVCRNWFFWISIV